MTTDTASARASTTDTDARPPIIDADGHVVETDETFADVPERFARYRCDPQRLLAVATLPMTSPESALAEAERCLDLGFVGAWRRPERFEGVAALHDPGHDRLFSLLAEADRPLAIHPGLNGVVPYEYFGERFDEDYSAMHAAHFPVEQMMSLTSLVAFGILDRHPTRRVALLETGATWLPFYAHRLDEHHETFGFPVATSTKPSEQIHGQVYVSVEEVEPGLAAMAETYTGNVVFASDYPHGDGTFPGAPDQLVGSREITDDALDRVLWANARTLYGLDTRHDHHPPSRSHDDNDR